MTRAGGPPPQEGPAKPEPAGQQHGSAGATESPLQAAFDALARARRSARTRGLRPGRVAGRDPGASAGEHPGAGLSRRRSGAAAPDARDPQPVGAEVERLLASRGWGAEVQVGAVVGRWPTIVGEHVASHVTPVGFTGATLTVRADSTAWATQMRLLTSSVLTRIETEVGAGVVSEIVVHGPAGPSWRKGALRSTGPGPRDTYG